MKTLKTLKTLIAALLISVSAFAQNVGINADGTAPDASAMLDVKSTTKGFLAPRVSSTSNVTSPATGLLVYQTGGTPGYYYNSGTPASPAWTQLGAASGASQWTTTGSDIYYSSGKVGIGTTTPVDGLTISTNTSTSNQLGLLDNRAMTQDVGGVLGFRGNDGIVSNRLFSLITGAKENGTSSDYSGYLAFQTRITGSAPTEKMRITSGGNVGIGTATPQAKLEVAGNVFINNTAAPGFYGQSAGTNKVYLGYDGAGTGLQLHNFTSGKTLLVQDNGYLTYTGNVGIGTTTPTRLLSLSGPQSVIRLYNSGTTTWTGIEMLANNGTLLANIGLDDASGRYGINMKSDGTEDFTITQSGNLGIGTTTPSQKLDVAGNIKITNQSGPVAAPDKIDLGTSYSNGATRDQCKIYLYDAGGNQKFGFGIGANADIQYHSYQAHDFYVDNSKRFSVTNSGGANTSDRRLKRDILPLNKYGLQQVMQLNPVTYIFKDDSANTPQVGFIAQEVQQIIPEVVTGKEGDLSIGESLGIVYGNLVPVLTKAIQEQQAEIEALKAENEALKAKVESIDNLKAEMEALKSAVYGTAQIKQQ
jgi:hypothetical protein